MLQIETLMVGREDTLLGRAVTLTPAPRGDQELDTAPHTTLIRRYSVPTVLYTFILFYTFAQYISLYNIR